MVAFRAMVDGQWQAKLQRRLRYRVTGLRPSGLPNLPFSLVLPFPPLSSTFLPFLFLFYNFLSFHPFPSSLPFSCSLFPTIFQQFSFTFSHFLLFPGFLAKATRLSVTSLPTLCSARHLTQANATCCESAFLHIFGILRHFQKKRVLIGETPKKEGLRISFFRTLSFFFRGKSDVHEMRKKKNFHLIRTLQTRGS